MRRTNDASVPGRLILVAAIAVITFLAGQARAETMDSQFRHWRHFHR